MQAVRNPFGRLERRVADLQNANTELVAAAKRMDSHNSSDRHLAPA